MVIMAILLYHYTVNLDVKCRDQNVKLGLQKMPTHRIYPSVENIDSYIIKNMTIVECRSYYSSNRNHYLAYQYHNEECIMMIGSRYSRHYRNRWEVGYGPGTEFGQDVCIRGTCICDLNKFWIREHLFDRFLKDYSSPCFTFKECTCASHYVITNNVSFSCRLFLYQRIQVVTFIYLKNWVPVSVWKIIVLLSITKYNADPLNQYRNDLHCSRSASYLNTVIPVVISG